MLFNSALLLCLIHVYRFSPRYVVTCLRYRYPPRSTEPIPISTVSNPVVLRYRSCQSIAVLRFLAASVRRPRHLSLSSYPLDLILPLFIFVVVLYIHVTNQHQASQEFGP